VPIEPVLPAQGDRGGDLALMRRIDELHLAHPFLGSRRLTQMLKREGRRSAGCMWLR